MSNEKNNEPNIFFNRKMASRENESLFAKRNVDQYQITGLIHSQNLRNE